MGDIIKHDSTPGVSAPRRHLFTVAEYYKLAAVGVLAEEARLELAEGEIIEMPPIGSLHAGWVDRLARLFIQRTGSEITVRVQNPVRLDDRNELQPDLALLRPRALPYAKAHPIPQDVLLIIEVADTTLAYDRDYKVPLYGHHGIPEVWLFDVNGRNWEIYLDPFETGYQRVLRPQGWISPALLPNVVIGWEDLQEL